MNHGDALAIRYANNRAEYRTAQKMVNLPELDDARTILNKAFDEWKDSGDETYHCEPWLGWIELLDNSDYFDPDKTSDAYVLARAYDQRRSLGRDLGKIRRAIAAHGRKLIRRGGES